MLHNILLGIIFLNLKREPVILESLLVKYLIWAFQVNVSLIITPRNLMEDTRFNPLRFTPRSNC